MNLKKKKRFNLNKELNFKSLLIRCAAFSLIFLLLGLIISLLFSFFMFNAKDSTSLTKIGGTSSLFLSVLITGFAQSKINRQCYLLGGIILGISIFVLTLIISLILTNGNITTNSILTKCLIPAFSVLGSMFGIRKENKRKRHYR